MEDDWGTEWEAVDWIGKKARDSELIIKLYAHLARHIWIQEKPYAKAAGVSLVALSSALLSWVCFMSLMYLDS